ncbi:hypothetical protein LCGC14_0785860 [marine sediment metagenome]|uniref:Uncharacterized protein n=1 Tax=marine sediment metagenome TaxID=412755 RepID=A0A0F9PYC8_9ZZZZ
MERRVEFSEPVSPFVTVSTIIHEEGNERLLVIETDGEGRVVFRGDDIAAFHDAVHKCEKVVATLELTLRVAKTVNAEQPAPDEAPVLNRAEKEILRALAHGDALWLKNDRAGLYGAVASIKEESIKSLWDARLIGPGDEPANVVDGMEDGLLWYTITDAGRRALVVQTPEAEREPALDSDQRWILSHMTDGSMLVWDPTVGDGQTVTIENGHNTLTKHELDLLHDAGYIAYDVDRSTSVGPKRYYAIADKGRRVLAAQVPS